MSSTRTASPSPSPSGTAPARTQWPPIPGTVDGVFPASCPSRTLLSHVTSKWGVLTLVALGSGTMRWAEIKRTVAGISEKMLISTLRDLEADGLVHRESYPVVPPRVEYSLTSDGWDVVRLLTPLLEPLAALADRNQGASS